MFHILLWGLFLVCAGVGAFVTLCFLIVIIGTPFGVSDIRNVFKEESKKSAIERNIRNRDKARWEWIARRMAILASYGISMDYFLDYLDEPEFLTDEWLDHYWETPLADYIRRDLDAIQITEQRTPQNVSRA